VRKNQLIEQLQKIKGNPEIKMWNGFVEDWTNIELVECELVNDAKNISDGALKKNGSKKTDLGRFPLMFNNILMISLKSKSKKKSGSSPTSLSKLKKNPNGCIAKTGKSLL